MRIGLYDKAGDTPWRDDITDDVTDSHHFERVCDELLMTLTPDSCAVDDRLATITRP